MDTTNDLIHSFVKQSKGKRISVQIKLNDKYKNGHEDFSITGTYWDTLDKRRRPTAMGCIHDEILELCPQMKIFVDLHLRDFTGLPMHPFANILFHLTQTKQGKEWNGKIRDYDWVAEIYDLPKDQKSKHYIEAAENKQQLFVILSELGVILKWEEKAKEGIKQLEALTGEKFASLAKRTHADVKIAQYEYDSLKELIFDTEYFSKKEVRARQEEKKKEGIEARIRKINIQAERKIKEIEEKRGLELLLVKTLGSGANFILYTPTPRISLNFHSYGTVHTQEELEKVQEALSVNNYDYNVNFYKG